jgi:hypothetical protein
MPPKALRSERAEGPFPISSYRIPHTPYLFCSAPCALRPVPCTITPYLFEGTLLAKKIAASDSAAKRANVRASPI